MQRIILLLAILFVIATASDTQTTDLKSLVGKKAVVQRMPFYVPGTYQAVSQSYAGQTATVIDVKPSTMYAGMLKLTPRQLASLPEQSRQSIENLRSAATLVVQFADGMKADTGAMPVMPTTLASYLEVLPDQASSVVQTASGAVGITPTQSAPANQTCPVNVTKTSSTNGGFSHAMVEAMTKSEYQRAYEKATNGENGPHYLDVRMQNKTSKAIRAIEAYAVYANAMGDEGEKITLLTQNDKAIKPDGEYKCYAVDTSTRSSNGVGDVTVYVWRVRFEDNTFWQDDGSHSCSLAARVK